MYRTEPQSMILDRFGWSLEAPYGVVRGGVNPSEHSAKATQTAVKVRRKQQLTCHLLIIYRYFGS